MNRKLGLGTVAFGMSYGVSNTNGQPGLDEVRAILALAATLGVTTLDTAALYGSSESVLGETLPPRHAFQIVTKTPRGVTGRDLSESLGASLERLRQVSVHGLLVHHFDDLTPDVAQALVSLKREGRVQRVGASIYTAAQIDRLLEHDGLDLVQVPINLLDQRLLASGHLQRLKARGFEIHARSVFLQGLLLMDPSVLPRGLASVEPHLSELRARAASGGLTMLQAALGFAHALPELDRVLVGVTTKAELEQIATAIDALPASSPALAALVAAAPWHDEKILNPALWERHA